MTNISIFRHVLPLAISLVIVASCMGGASAQEGLLDGRVFIGKYSEKHKKEIKEDELRFLSGKFYSRWYGKSGFNEGAYTTRVDDDKIYFETQTISPKKGTIKWKGTVHGDSIEVNFHLSKKGWFSDTEKDYFFTGELKK